MLPCGSKADPWHRGPARFVRERSYPAARVFTEMAQAHTSNFRLQRDSVSLLKKVSVGRRRSPKKIRVTPLSVPYPAWVRVGRRERGSRGWVDD
jgi:hypothetical protein